MPSEALCLAVNQNIIKMERGDNLNVCTFLKKKGEKTSN